MIVAGLRPCGLGVCSGSARQIGCASVWDGVTVETTPAHPQALGEILMEMNAVHAVEMAGFLKG
jgi:hypothetical protein